MDKVELKRRTQRFAVEILKFADQLPNKRSLNVLSNELLDAQHLLVPTTVLHAKGNQQLSS